MCIVVQSLAQLLCEMRDVNKALQFEVDDLKQKLKDSNGDIKVCFCDAFTSINDIKRESPEHQIARMSKN